MDMQVTHQDVLDRKEATRKRPKEDWFIGKPGYKREYPDPERPNYYTWEYQCPTNDGHGKTTSAFQETVEMLKPSIEADTDRSLKLNKRIPKVKMTADDGRTVYVPEVKADAAAKKNGWHYRWKPGGFHVERGFTDDGKAAMLWRWCDGWEPLGKTCLGTPLNGDGNVSRVGLQFDPSGQPWRWLNGKWEAMS